MSLTERCNRVKQLKIYNNNKQCYENPNLLKKAFSTTNIFQTQYLDKLLSKTKRENKKRMIGVNLNNSYLDYLFNNKSTQNNITFLIPNRNYYYINNNKNKISKKIKTIRQNLSVFNTSVNKPIYKIKKTNFCYEYEKNYKNLSCKNIIQYNEKSQKKTKIFNLKKEKKIDLKRLLLKQKYKSSLETNLFFQKLSIKGKTYK